MILLDALYVNNGGAKILLDYLVLSFEKYEIDVFYLLDDRIKDDYLGISKDKIIYLKANFLKRRSFYKTNKNRFSKVFCFGNLPPNIRLDAEVFTYFHQVIYLDIPKEFSFIEKLKFKLKISVLKRIVKNTDYWLVQSDFIKQKMQAKFGFHTGSIKIMPFYPNFESLQANFERVQNTYLYVSNAAPYKNHKRLIDVFCRFYDKYKIGELIVTINDSYPEIVQLINDKVLEGYPIENIGFVDRLTLQKKYLTSEFLIFPSLTESFGLGLIEAIECGCKVIGADLSYTYEVCEPSFIFNPLDEKSILDAFAESLHKENLKTSVPRIQNNIKEIINLLR